MTIAHLLEFGPSVTAAFLASIVEVVEAFTIMLAVGSLRGWRNAWTGTAAALLVLAGIIALFGPLLSKMPLSVLQLVVGTLCLVFGMGWLRKAILRSAGIIPLHDETAAFAVETQRLNAETSSRAQNWMAALTAFKAVLLEGLEVAFIVIAAGAGSTDKLWVAAGGALLACVLVLLIGITIHKPLARVPENTLKFTVGIMLSAFGVFWTGEGLGIAWPGQDAALLVFFALFFVSGVGTAFVLRHTLSLGRV